MTPTLRCRPRPAVSGLALAGLGAVLVLAAAQPAAAIKLWERQKKGRPTAPETGSTASAPATPRPAATAETSPAAPAESRSTRRASRQASAGPGGLTGEIANALGVALPTSGAADPATFVLRTDHRRTLVPLHAAARAEGLSGEERTGRRLALAAGLASRGHAAAAGAEYLALLSEQPSLHAAWTDLGAILRVEGAFALSLRALDEAFALSANDGRTWYQLGLTRQARGDLPGADEAYLAALEADPSLWLPAVNPHVVVNDRAHVALHGLYLKTAGATGPLAGAAAMP